jgi:hypothetical protein
MIYGVLFKCIAIKNAAGLLKVVEYYGINFPRPYEPVSKIPIKYL